MSWYGKPNATIANIHVCTGDANGSADGSGVIQCNVAAIIDEELIMAKSLKSAIRSKGL